MKTTSIDGSTISWDDTGSGPATLTIHAGAFGAWFDPLASVLDGRLIRMRRAGYAEGPVVDHTVPIAVHADHAAGLIHALGLPVMVAAHSSGCVIALELARKWPDLVSGLVLSEPPLLEGLLDPADAAQVGATIGPVIGASLEAAAGGDIAGALDIFLTAVCGPGYAEVIAGILGPAWRARAERDASFFFANEIPALLAWSPGDLSAITTPTLLVQGGDSPPPTHRLIARLASTLPQARVATVEGANHLLPLTHPAQLAALIADVAG